MPDRRASRSEDAVPARSVWPTGSVDRVAQLAAGGYLPATASDTSGIPPAVAAHAVRAYTEPGDMVLDPDCGAGTVLVEALRAGRHAVGMTGGRGWPVARANLTAAKLAGALSDGMVLQRPGRRSGYPRGDLAAATVAGLAGRVDLLLTCVRLDREPDRTGSRRGAGESPGSPDPDPRPDRLRAADRLAAVLVRCRPLLRPGGHVILVVQPGPASDAPDAITGTAARAGLIPVERCLAPTTPRRPPRRTRRRPADRGPGRPVRATPHLDVYVFRVPPDVDEPALAALPVPTRTPVAAAESPAPVPAPAGPVAAPGRWAA